EPWKVWCTVLNIASEVVIRTSSDIVAKGQAATCPTTGSSIEGIEHCSWRRYGTTTTIRVAGNIIKESRILSLDATNCQTGLKVALCIQKHEHQRYRDDDRGGREVAPRSA